jgi:hypothetical protein
VLDHHREEWLKIVSLINFILNVGVHEDKSDALSLYKNNALKNLNIQFFFVRKIYLIHNKTRLK